MKIQVLLLAASLFTLSASAQTKKIALRSHSGSDSHFDLSGEDNFGIYIKPDTTRHLIVAPAPSDSAKTGNAKKTSSSSKATKKKSATKKKAR